MADSPYDEMRSAVARANDAQRNLYVVFIATKPCFIKMASLVRAFDEAGVPFVLVSSGQHYEELLSAPIAELGYRHRVNHSLRASGPLAHRCGVLARGLSELAGALRDLGLRTPAVPVVSGDTWSAGLIPALWLMQNGVRSVHVEAGLRSEGPDWLSLPAGCEALKLQLDRQWSRYPDSPFPEGLCTRLALSASALHLAPTERNVQHLLREGIDLRDIAITGSLSADAVDDSLAKPDVMESALQTLYETHPELAIGSWIRVDIHRRDNMTPAAMRSLLGGLSQTVRAGVKVVLVETNAFRRAARDFMLEDIIDKACAEGLLITPMWPSYRSVLAFIRSTNCRGVFTDSGGLQEEAHVLGIRCLTARTSTDRAETVLDSGSNRLVPLNDPCQVHRQLVAWFCQSGACPPRSLYGKNVGGAVVDAINRAERHSTKFLVHTGLRDW